MEERDQGGGVLGGESGSVRGLVFCNQLLQRGFKGQRLLSTMSHLATVYLEVLMLNFLRFFRL